MTGCACWINAGPDKGPDERLDSEAIKPDTLFP